MTYCDIIHVHLRLQYVTEKMSFVAPFSSANKNLKKKLWELNPLLKALEIFQIFRIFQKFQVFTS